MRVSRTPGRTRLVNFFRVTVLDGERRLELRLVDLPGFGYAHVSKAERATWRPGIPAYLSGRRGLAAVLLLCDVRRGIQAEERDLAPWIAAQGARVIPVITKGDQLPKHKRSLVCDEVKQALGSKPVLTSADENEGKAALWRQIVKAIDAQAAAAPHPGP